MSACAALPTGADATLSAALAALDCQVNGAVAAGYGRLFAVGGAFGAALTALLTIYVAILAYGLITGRTRLTLAALTPKALAFGLVLTFATAWPAYQTVVYGLLTGGPDQVASAFMGARGGAAQAFASRLDMLFDAVVRAAQAVDGQPKSPNLEVASRLIWTSAMTLLLATLGLLLVARIVLAALLALGPVFIVLALFGGTRGLFEGWLRTACAFAFAPMLIVLGGSGVMAVIGPLIGAIADDPARAVADLRPIVTLFLAAMVYAALVLTLGWTATSLTRGWRLPFAGEGDRAAGALAGQAGAAGAAATAIAACPAAPMGAERVSGVVAAVLREDGRGGGARIQAVRPADAAARAPTATAARRTEGLGQTFRASAPARALAGRIGS